MKEDIIIEQLSEELLREIDADIKEGIDATAELTVCETNLRNIQLEEEDIAASTKGKAQYIALKIESSKAMIPRHELLRQRKIALKRQLAMGGHATMLEDLIIKDHLKMVIPFMVEPYINSVERTRKFIKRCVSRLLSGLIPMGLKKAVVIYGTRPFIPHPGFAWICSEEYNSHKYWIIPDCIYYFPQFEEMEILRNNYPVEKLRVVDRAIDRLLQAQINLRKRQAQIAMKLARVCTYEELINFNVDCAIYIFQKVGIEICEEALTGKTKK